MACKDPLLDSSIERCYTYDYGEDETEQTNCSGDAKADEFRWIQPIRNDRGSEQDMRICLLLNDPKAAPLKSGDNMYVDLDHAFLIDDLATICSRLPARDNVLAGMLIRWFDLRGTLSAKQLALGLEILQRNQELVNA